MRRLVMVLALVAGIFVPATSAFATPTSSTSDSAPGSVGIRLLEVPENSADDPRARSYIVDNLSPGTTIHRRFEITNTSSAPIQVAVYTSAASISNGQFTGAAGATPNELTTWTSLTADSVQVAANGNSTQTITVAVPADAPSGEQYAVLWAQVGAPNSTGITQVNRVGIRMYVSVGPGGGPASSFTIESLTPARSSDGAPVVSALVHNAGGRALDIQGTLTLSDGPGGVSAGPFAVQNGLTLAPGDSRSIDTTLSDQLADGPWTATVELSSGLIHQSAKATISFPPKAGGPGTAVPATVVTSPPVSHTTRNIVLIAVVLVVLLVGGYFLGAWRARHRVRRDTPVG